ncbi:uncharacterized protein LOC114720550 [Neltuma alba]|uniref:uncharacterized protein LOC114720550 n=1 Tax=Neltuma alba TaxID=207710 RepID=UPI0010A5741F|nr:uncharacterized protein LOC114720550 [Prosopis alba]
MKKFICLALLFVIAATIAGVEADGYGVCGKFSPDRMLTHVLRHCKKPARDLTVPVSPKCCEPLSHISVECFYAIINSDTWKYSGLNPRIAFTIPRRCHHLIHHPH